MGEINTTIGACRALHSGEHLALIPLHGELQPEEQDVAFAPNPLRKIVVSTNVAETSVTIDGIRFVVDSGQARIARYDAERGIGTLAVEQISRASADQRDGSPAGRTAPGGLPPPLDRERPSQPPRTQHSRNPAQRSRRSGLAAALAAHPQSRAIRLARQTRSRRRRTRGEICCASWARSNLAARRLPAATPARHPFPSPKEPARPRGGGRLPRRAPSLPRWGEGEERSQAPAASGLCRVHSDLTPIGGGQMLRLPMHPRYSRMLIEASRSGCVRAAALCAALVSGRDLLQRLRRDDKHIAEARELFEASQDSDFFTLMRAYQFAEENNFAH